MPEKGHTIPLPREFSRCKASVLVMKGDRELARFRPDAKGVPASITKLMTLYLVFQAMRDRKLGLGDTLTYKQHRLDRPRESSVDFKPGATITLQDAIIAAYVVSSNTAARLLGVFVSEARNLPYANKGGNHEKAFVDLMNRTARQIGMKKTVFRNSSGWPVNGMVTTARDLAILVRAVHRMRGEKIPGSEYTFGWLLNIRSLKKPVAILKNPGIRLSKASFKRLPNSRDRNSNPLAEDGATIKTGFGGGAFNIAVVLPDGRVGVIIGAPKPASRNELMRRLLDSTASITAPSARTTDLRIGPVPVPPRRPTLRKPPIPIPIERPKFL